MSRGSDRVKRAEEGGEGRWRAVDVVSVLGPTGAALLGAMPGSATVGAAGNAATGNVTAAGVESRRRAWMVPVTRLASSATFQRRSEAPGSRRRRRVTNHATPRSTVL